MGDHTPISLDQGPEVPSWVPKAILTLVIAVVILGGMFAAGWFAHREVSADGTKDPQRDLIVRLDRNRLGLVNWSDGFQVCVTLLKSDFTPEDPVACVDTDQVLNYTDYDYGPSALPSLGELYDIHKVDDLGVQSGLVFYLPGKGPNPLPTPTSAAEPSPTPGVNVPTATPTK
ncbi:MAG: hypothetical protein Q8P13_01365 [bacterium]|nr:hypothetical protein [bacterium]